MKAAVGEMTFERSFSGSELLPRLAVLGNPFASTLYLHLHSFSLATDQIHISI